MLDWLRRLFGGKPAEEIKDKDPPQPEEPAHRRRGKYDAAQTNNDNRRHWSNADALSARAANNPGVRQVLRGRSRYECENNGYAGGLVQTLADDMVGVGPTLQVQSESDLANRQVETAWKAWTAQLRNGPAGGLAETLHLMRQAKARCGETFGLLRTEPDMVGPVKLDFQLVEAEQVGPPIFAPMSWTPGVGDGIELDQRGRPAAYYVYKFHPGDGGMLATMTQTTYRVQARYVVHWFRMKRPGQLRGVPEVTAGLPLFAQQRRWTLATLTAAETAADFAAVLETTGPADGETDEPTPFEALEIERGMLVTMPGGAKLSQLKAEHPTAMYGDFKHELLKEIGRPVSAPFCVTAGDSSPYNYSSARLDHSLYRAAVRVERKWCEGAVLERLYRAFLEEASLVPGLIPDGFTADVAHVWNWPGFATIDPLKEVQADTIDLSNGTTTLAILLGEKGLDWEEVMRQRARELALMRELGLPVPGAATPPPPVEDRPIEDEQPPGPPKRQPPAARRYLNGRSRA